ncbi:recombination protein RecR [Candidatus Uhrbacteria bacterium]|nr:recombination protein RecR [Candidatus Uhrbacteria bacterium]
MRRFPEPIQNVVSALGQLPGVGPKTALRYVYHLLKQPRQETERIARHLLSLAELIKICPRCFSFSQSIPCDICRDPNRVPGLLCVVEESRDIATFEDTGVFKGYYLVLGGTLNPIEGITPDVLHVRDLEDRLKAEPAIEEVILALSPTASGETTMLYLARRLSGGAGSGSAGQPLGRRVTRLARGLPIGASIEYADEVTLGDALRGRRSA